MSTDDRSRRRTMKMVDKKRQKQIKTRIQAAQASDKKPRVSRPPNPKAPLKEQIQAVLDQRDKALLEKREAEKQLRVLGSANRSLERDLLESQRKLKAREKDVADMHNNHIEMRRSLSDVRTLHLPVEATYDPDDHVLCQECGKRWPCPTYRKIKTPDHVVVSSLIEMERALQKKEPEPNKE